jgi:hypothetical protein
VLKKSLSSFQIPSLDQGVGVLLGDKPLVADAVSEPGPLSFVDSLSPEFHPARIAESERMF